MADPISISEITNVRGDADNAGGVNAVLPASNAAQYIQQAAQARATFNNYVAKKHEDRLNDAVKQVADLDYKNVLSTDLPEIGQEYAAAMKDISDNYGVITDPTTNLKKYGEIKQRVAQLQAKINTSTAHNNILAENKKMIALHPDWNTEDNQKMVNEFVQTPIDQRKDFMLKTPESFDPSIVANAAMAATRKISDTERLSKDKHYIMNVKGEYYDPDEYLKNAKAIAQSTMHNGRSLYQDFSSMYDKIPTAADAEKPSQEEVFNQSMLANLKQNTKMVSMKPNEVAMANDRIAQSERESRRANALGWARINLDGKAIKAGDIKPEDAADAKYLSMYDVLRGRGLNQEFGQNIYGSDPETAIKYQVGGDQAVDAKGMPIRGKLNPIVVQKIPAMQFIEAKPIEGHRIEVTLMENKLVDGKLQSKPITKVESYDQMKTSFNRILGNKIAPQIASGSAAFNRKILKTTNPTVKDLVKRYAQEPTPEPRKKKFNPTTYKWE